MEARNAKAARLPLLVQVIRLVRAGDIDDREQWTELAGWLSEKASRSIEVSAQRFAAWCDHWPSPSQVRPSLHTASLAPLRPDGPGHSSGHSDLLSRATGSTPNYACAEKSIFRVRYMMVAMTTKSPIEPMSRA